MQLDKTRIGVRERGMTEIFDLSLHVLRKYWQQLVAPLAIGILPFALLNYFLVRRFLEYDYTDGLTFQYYWLMTALVFFQSQFATSLATLYLGNAVFDQRMTLNELLASWGEMWFQMVWCQLGLRGVLPAMILVYFIDPSRDGVWLLHFLLALLVVYASALRSMRSYINEVILFERNPFNPPSEHAMYLGKRSSMLHGPSQAELFGRWLGAVAFCVMLAASLLLGVIWCVGLIVDEWTLNDFINLAAFPAILWLVASYMAVVRYLSYLDLRIRLEGWEVELKLRAEGFRWMQNIS